MKRTFYLLLLFLPVVLRAQSIHIVAATDTICAGSLIHFSATTSGVSMPHYRWTVNNAGAGTDSAGFSTNALHNGDRILCRLVNGAGDTVFAVSDSIHMTVQQMPVVSPIMGTDSVVCVGATITFSDSTAGGVWKVSSGRATISGGVVSAVLRAYEFEFDTVFYIRSSVCGSDTAARSIAIDDVPIVFFSSVSTICVGEVVLVDDFEVDLQSRYGYVGKCDYCGDGDFTYLTALKAGTDYIFSTETNKCGTSTYGMWVTATDKPFVKIIAPADICVGGTIKLTDSTSGTSLKWEGNNIFVDSSGTMTAVVAGLATVRLSASNRCGTASATEDIVVQPPGIVQGPDSICTGAYVQLSDTLPGGTWSSNDVSVVTVDPVTGVAKGVNKGSAYISYTRPGGCSDTKRIDVVVCPDRLVAFPNPANAELTMQADTSFFYGYAVMNSIGQTIVKGQLIGTETKINTRYLAPGIYLVSVYGYYDVHSIKFRKE